MLWINVPYPIHNLQMFFRSMGCLFASSMVSPEAPKLFAGTKSHLIDLPLLLVLLASYVRIFCETQGHKEFAVSCCEL